MRRALCVLSLFFAFAPCAPASTLQIGGHITQAVPDGTGPALANPSLNAINEGQSYLLTLTSSTDVTGPGVYSLTGSSLGFLVPAASATESGFSTISLTVTANGAFDDFSLFACLTGTDCFMGNALSASFRIPGNSFGGMNVAATGLDLPHPLDLLEDDGLTDFQGSITTYSNTAQVVTPEPSSGSLAVLALLATALFGLRTQRPLHVRRSL